MMEALRRARRRGCLGEAEPIDRMWQALGEQRAARRAGVALSMTTPLRKIIGAGSATFRRLWPTPRLPGLLSGRRQSI